VDGLPVLLSTVPVGGAPVDGLPDVRLPVAGAPVEQLLEEAMSAGWLVGCCEGEWDTGRLVSRCEAVAVAGMCDGDWLIELWKVVLLIAVKAGGLLKMLEGCV